MSEFTDRIDLLMRRTDAGELLRGSVTMDQVYAHRQHEDLSYHHPRGGHAQYLRLPLYEHAPDYLRAIAGGWLEDGGKRAMARSMEHLSDAAELQAPWEFVDLARSGSPKVEVGHRTDYERPPKQHRLTEQELKIKNRLRWPSLPDALKGWIYWHNTARGKAGLPPPRRHK